MRRGGVLTIGANNVDVDPGQLDDRTIAGRFVRVALADTGAGMDKETQARAFEPFFTTRSTAAGLGLATAASILRSSGGDIPLGSGPPPRVTVEGVLPPPDRPAEPAATLPSRD